MHGNANIKFVFMVSLCYFVCLPLYVSFPVVLCFFSYKTWVKTSQIAGGLVLLDGKFVVFTYLSTVLLWSCGKGKGVP